MNRFTTPLLFIVLLFIVHHSSAQSSEAPKKYYHVLVVKWTDSLDTSLRTEVLNLFRGLPEKVDGFESVDIIDLAASSEGFDTIIIQEFVSDEAEKRYEQHPDHQRITEIGPQLVSGLSLFDYWK